MASLICSNCGKAPSEHRVVNEKLTCADGQMWRYAKEYRIGDLVRRIADADALGAALRRQLSQLLEG